jgi:hypothetical protein
MRLRQLARFGFLVLVPGLAAACAGGQTGDLSGEHNTGDSGGCDEQRKELPTFDTQTDAGSAAELLAYAEQTFDVPITWQSAPQGQSWSAGPESGKGRVHVAVSRGKHAYQLTYTQKPSSSGLDVAAICPPPALAVEAHVDVTTDGGALAESFDTLLRSTVKGVAMFGAPLDLSNLGGSLAVSIPNKNEKLVQLGIEATLTSAGSTGSISGMDQIESGGAVGAGKAVLAVWPADAACASLDPAGEGLGLAMDDEVLGESGAQTLADFAEEGVDVAWLDQSTTKLKVGFESLGDGCFRVRSDVPVEIGGGPTATYPVRFVFSSEDGKLDGKYDGQIIVSGGSHRRVEASAYRELAVSDVDQSGFSGVSVPAGTDALRINVQLQKGEQGGTGTVQLLGVTKPPCLTEPVKPMPTPGGGSAVPACAGESVTPLESASWNY